MDRSSPTVWGLPQPADGVLQLGDLISLTFTEDIDPNSVLPGCVSVRIPRNSMLIDVNVQVNGSSISIVPNIDNIWLENETLEVKVQNLKDLCGNAMVGIVQWEFFVNANPVAWVEPKLEIIKPLGQSMQITTSLINSGGQTSSFTITDLPEWLTVNTSSGTLLPLSSQTLVFTVSNQLGYGAFRDTVYAFIPGLGNEPLIFEINVLANPPAWATTQLDNYEYSMTITGQLQMEGEISTDTNDIIAAFVLDANDNYECRGYANLQTLPYLEGVYQFFLTINSDFEDGEELLFRVWDSSTSKEHFGISEEYFFMSGAVYGTSLNPVTIHVSPDLIRSISCRNGWNWISVNLINSEAMDVNTLLSSLTPTTGDIVKNQTSYNQYVPGMGWVGSMGDISTTGMVKIKLSNPDQLDITGLLENPVTTPITYGAGWNWIGYLPHVSISVNQALANIPNPVTGDLVKSQTGYSQYFEGYGWFGSLLFMDAGKGFMLNTANAGSFTYPDYVLPREETNTFSSANFDNLRELTGWDVNPLEYEYSSNITAVVQFSGEILNNENILLGAFYGDDCRGVSTPVRVLDQWVFFLTQYSNTLNQPLTYKVYLADSDEVVDAVEALPFINNQILGNPLNPYTFHILAGSLDTPQNVRMEIEGSTLTLRWDTVTGANSYKIYASDSPDGEFSDVSSLGRSNIISGGKPDTIQGIQSSQNTSRNSEERTYQSWSCDIAIMQRKFYFIKASTDMP